MCARKQLRRLSRPGGIPTHSLFSSAVQGANVFCAVALDIHSMKAALMITAIFIIKSLGSVGACALGELRNHEPTIVLG